MQENPEQNLVGQQIDHYRVDALLGSGGMGEVYRAEDLRLNRTVAIKRMRETIADSPSAQRLFLREAKTACTLVHPYIATVFDVIERDGAPLIVMEYIEGRGLDQVIEEDRPTPERVREYALEISQALAVIHEAGLVHRDLKPANIMVTGDGHVKVMDFGLTGRNAGSVDPNRSTTVSVTTELVRRGTPAYMSPEQVRGFRLDHRSDLFSLGIILYQALTGQHPFMRDTVADTLSSILNDAPGDNDETVSLTRADALGAIALKLLEKNVDDRYADARELEQDLRTLTAPVLPVGRGVPGLGQRKGVIATLAIASILVLAVALMMLRDDARTTIEVEGRPTVAVWPLAGGEEEDEAGPMVAGLLTAHLTASEAVRPIGQDRVVELLAASDSLPFSDRLERVARGLTAQWVLTGKLYRESSAFVGVFELHEINAGTSHSFTLTRPRASDLARQASMTMIELVAGVPPEEFAALLVSDSDEALELYQRAEESRRNLDYKRALEQVERCLNLDPDFIMARLLHGRLLDTVGYESRAIEEIEAALVLMQKEPSGVSARQRSLVEATLARFRNDNEHAERLYTDLIARFPDEPDLRVALAGVLRRAGRVEEARLQYDTALANDPMNPRLHLALASVQVEQADPEGAESSLEEAERLFELFRIEHGRAEIAEQRAYWSYKQRDYGEAERWYDEAYTAYEAQGLTLRAMGPLKSIADMKLYQWQLEEAAETYQRVVPRAVEAGHLSLAARTLNSQGATYMRLEQWDAAAATLDEAQTRAAELARLDLELSAASNRATVLNVLNRTREGRAVAERAIALARELQNPEKASRASLRLADALRREGALEEAAKLLRSLLQVEFPGGGVDELQMYVQQQLFEVAMDGGDDEAGLAAATAAVAIARGQQTPSLVFSLSLRARVLFRLQRGDEADRVLEEASRLLSELDSVPEVKAVYDHAEMERLASRGEWETLLRRTEVAVPPAQTQVLLAIWHCRSLAALDRRDEARSCSRQLAESPWPTAGDREKIARLVG